MSKQMTYRQFADHLKQRQRLRQRKMRQPQDEWWPEAHFVVPEGGLRTVPIDPSYFRDRLTKRMLVGDIIVPAIHTSRARLFGLQLVMYMLSSENPAAQEILNRPGYDPEGIPFFADIPGRIEVVHIVVWDAERAESWVARITRPESGPPTLAPWEMADMDTLGGPMFDPITAALR